VLVYLAKLTVLTTSTIISVCLSVALVFPTVEVEVSYTILVQQLSKVFSLSPPGELPIRGVRAASAKPRFNLHVTLTQLQYYRSVAGRLTV